MTKFWMLTGGFLTLILAVGSVVFVTTKDQDEHADGPHYHAGFQVYIDNELQDFSDLQYMKLAPCSDHHAEDLSPEQEQLEKAHLHDSNGDVVHLHRNNVTWRDLFINMEYELPDRSRVAYINGDLVSDDVLDHPVQAYDSLVIFIGTNNDVPEKLTHAVTRERIEEVEGLSEDCGTDEAI